MLISEQYRSEQEKLHQNPNYGVASVEFAPIVTNIINQLEVSEMLDYGAGKGRLGQTIDPDHTIMIDHYDPARPEWSATPVARQFVACIDVLEHIEIELIDNVLDDLKRVTIEYGFFTVHTGPAKKTLSDGRNAHLIQKDYRWWMPRLWSRFRVLTMQHTSSGFYVIVGAK